MSDPIQDQVARPHHHSWVSLGGYLEDVDASGAGLPARDRVGRGWRAVVAGGQ